MTCRPDRHGAAMVVILIACSTLSLFAEREPFSPEAIRFFENEIRPLLRNKCADCHNNQLLTSGLSVESRETILRGGNRGEAVSLGLPEESRLVHAIRRQGELKMPPGEPLSPPEVSALVRWIEMRLPWPARLPAGNIPDRSSMHWSFQPIERPAEPKVSDPLWVRNPIDSFILARLDRQGLQPTPEAEKATLIRRVYIDLISLLPKPEEVEAFVGDIRPDAYERVVDHLLESPHYGERWGRHWLDLARYADSNGYNADGERKIWMYRDWVIRALNRDLPFNQFVIEQIAGDLLPNATEDQIVATGFHRNTMLNLEGGIDFEQYRVEAVVDRVNTTGVVFLGLTLGCARCHDHKYDPVSQREFYEFFAFFNSIDELSGEFNNDEGRARASEPVLEFGTPEQYARREALRAQLEVMQEELKTYEEGLLAKQAQWEACLSDDDLVKLSPSQRAILEIPTEDRHEEQRKSLRRGYFNQDVGHQERRKAVAAVQKLEPEIPSTLVMREFPEPRPTHVLLGGEFLNKGVRVWPGTPAVLPELPAKERYTRLDLARWLVDEKNPLTPRVTVSRVWQRYFGRGIVETENDFGTQGLPPSHPELLDWLASEFVSRDWSLKAIHRLIVTSATYRQSSKYRPDTAKKDPRNRLLARQNRLRVESEIVRDLALSASNMLVPEIGGPSVFPPQPAGIMIRETSFARAGESRWPKSEGKDRYRRGMYTHFWRTSPHPALMVFDSPNSLTSATSRNRSNTPLQALTLLNDAGFHEFAQGLAQRILRERPNGTNSERVEHLFRVCLTRTAQQVEKERLERLLETQLDDFRTNPSEAEEILSLPTPVGVDRPEAAAWTMVASVVLNLDEFITRE
ncbi:PSD1 and planctomycete cytochrome C domain-containing protein [Acidobacteria bacterium AH-259-G07]|nr:PSD1 and planctomycete cytochrome C domain-containing protein [Acidobacteria bacterium AH-259-G07]